MTESYIKFFEENEKKVNRKVSYLSLLIIPVGFLLMILKKTQIFPLVSYKSLTIFTCIITLLALCQLILGHFKFFRSVDKYLIFLTIEFSVLFLSVQPGLVMFISYIFVPLASCMYFSKQFTLRMSLICYLGTIFSICLRSKSVDPNPFAGNVINNVNVTAYILGISIEYLLVTILCYATVSASSESLVKQYEHAEKIEEMKKSLISGFANLVESKDDTTGKHIKRTSEYVKMIAERLRDMGYYTNELDDNSINIMVNAAPLHDLGKMVIPESILCKPGKLSTQEFEVIKVHPLEGDKLIVKNLDNVEDKQFVETASMMALCHHEWWNGHGYPMHLVGDEIPLVARIMAAADVLDALLSVRPYKPAFTLEASLLIIKKASGTQFDPHVVDAVMDLKSDFEKKLEEND